MVNILTLLVSAKRLVPGSLASRSRWPHYLDGIADMSVLWLADIELELKKLSHDTVRNVFMVIEEPENPLVFPERRAKAIAPEYHTIGEFYEAVSKLIGELGESIFKGDPKRQVTGWFGPDQLFPVDSVATAQKAIEIIVTQGEGTATSPAGRPAPTQKRNPKATACASVEARMASTWNDCENSSQRNAMAMEAA